MLRILDSLFFVFHTVLIAFVLAGWAWRKTRRLHLSVVLLTLLSWCVLGIRYGFGYCPCTDWHWRVREQLGHSDMPASYIKFLIDSLTGWNVSARLVDAAAVAGLLAVFAASTVLNVRDWIGKRR